VESEAQHLGNEGTNNGKEDLGEGFKATEMENSMNYVLNRYLVMGDFTVGTMFNQPLAGNGRLSRLRFPVLLDEMWTNYPA
jgi:hypothetical protein